MPLETVSVSNIRKSMSEYFIEAAHRKKLVILSRYEREKAYLVGEDLFETLLRCALPAPELEVFTENDGSETLAYRTLDLVANGNTYEEAVEDLIIQAQEYADEYLEDINLYQKDVERKKHLPMLVLIAISTSKGDVRTLLGL
ncbi:MAG: hypothetical protein ACOCRO_11640 [Halanaerobiales bacterium]